MGTLTKVYGFVEQTKNVFFYKRSKALQRNIYERFDDQPISCLLCQ